MAKKEPPQEYIEVLEVLNVLYDEVDGEFTVSEMTDCTPVSSRSGAAF